MATITAGDFRNGKTFEMDGKIMQVVEFQHVKPGKGAAFVRTKMKNIVTGAVTETSFNPTAKFEEAFVERMNRRAAELGMNDTTFKNACGLPAEGHVTSAYDIALMSRELMLHHPDIRTYTTVWMDTLRDGASSLVNTNKLVRFYDGTTGLKTGSTRAAGYCISATAERDGMELIAVILKGKTSPDRFADAQTLLNYGFASYALKTVIPDEPLPPVPVQLGTQGTVQPRVDPAEGLLLAEKSRLQGLEQTVTLPESAEAPVRQGDVLGTLTVTQNGETVLEVPIRAAETVEKLTFGQMLLRLARTMCFCG